MHKVLVVGDAVVATGFAKATHAYAAGLQAAGCEVHVLGMHYTGDPHEYKNLDGTAMPIYTSWPGGDSYGIGRIRNVVTQIAPDVIIIQQDPWNFPQYLAQLKGIDIPVVGIVAVDGKHCQGEKLGALYGEDMQVMHPGLSMAVFWTKFGLQEAREGGWRGKSAVIPLGVDLDVFKPLDKEQARKEILHQVFERYDMPKDTYVVGTVGRNQLRKRLDLMIRYFAEWVHGKGVKDAVLWMHSAPTGDDAYDLKRLARYFGVQGRILVPDINPMYGVSEELLTKVYNTFDVFMLTGVGEGWSLPTLEAMACGVPCIVPDWSALGEWAKPAAWLCECPLEDVAPIVQSVGGRMGQREALEALGRIYVDPDVRRKMREDGLALAAQPQYRWEHIGQQLAQAIDELLTPKVETFEPARKLAHAV